MSEYTVSYSEISVESVDIENYGGVLIHIRPPVQLNSDAVERYLTFKDLEPIDRADPKLINHDVKHVVVLGSTPEQTTIYASIAKQYDEGLLAEQLANDTVRLLRFMGTQAIIGNPPAPEA